MEEAIAAQKQELKKLEDQRDLQVMAANLKAYSEADSGEAWDEDEAACIKVASCALPCKEISQQTCKNYNREQAINNYNKASLGKALHDTMVLTRLPAPEPSVFSGDSHKFLEWSTSFKSLI